MAKKELKTEQIFQEDNMKVYFLLTLKKKRIEAQHQELVDSCKSNLQKGFNSCHSDDHQQNVYKH